MSDVQIVSLDSAGQSLRSSFNPRDSDIRVNSRGQFVRVNQMGEPVSVVNSLLPEDAWVELDRAILEAARYPLRLVTDLRSRGLVAPRSSGSPAPRPPGAPIGASLATGIWPPPSARGGGEPRALGGPPGGATRCRASRRGNVCASCRPPKSWPCATKAPAPKAR